MPQFRLQKPKAILLDVIGTMTYTTFVDNVLAHYVRKNIRHFVMNNWGHEQIQRDINMTRAAAQVNPGWPQIATQPPEAIQENIEALMNFCLDNNTDCLGLAQLR